MNKHGEEFQRGAVRIALTSSLVDIQCGPHVHRRERVP